MAIPADARHPEYAYALINGKDIAQRDMRARMRAWTTFKTSLHD
ncbi:Spermidine/putrescine-binding periplasmic protein [Pseudomonas chlororaphis]|nr:Spermidine/putrescine-binding periplasmic protein [Pseudomonas chlororaphis]